MFSIIYIMLSWLAVYAVGIIPAARINYAIAAKDYRRKAELWVEQTKENNANQNQHKAKCPKSAAQRALMEIHKAMYGSPEGATMQLERAKGKVERVFECSRCSCASRSKPDMPKVVWSAAARWPLAVSIAAVDVMVTPRKFYDPIKVYENDRALGLDKHDAIG